MPEQQDKPEQPNLVFYEVLTGTLDTGQHVLVQVFRKPDGKITLEQLAFRAHNWETWGVPVRLTHMSTTDNEGRPA